MLILTRKRGTSIIIGKDIEVGVLAVTNGQVKLGIAAPETVPIARSELLPFKEHQSINMTLGADNEVGLE